MPTSDLIVLRLAREGFWGGSPTSIHQAPTDQVLDAWEYVRFQDDYEGTLLELNKPTT